MSDFQPSEESQPETPADHNASQQELQIAARRLVGIELDALCTGGRHGGTSFLPITANVSAEIESLLGVTAYHIPTGTRSANRKRELDSPRAIPIDTFRPNGAAHFWSRVTRYAADHEGDTNPRLFGKLNADDIKAFLRTKSNAIERNELSGGSSRDCDIPMYASITRKDQLNSRFFEGIQKGDVQGIILEKSTLIQKAHEEWEKFRDTQQVPVMHARPFMGLQGSTEELVKFMHGPEEVDTLVFSDTPSLEAAQEIRKLHLRDMRKRANSKKIENPFHNTDVDELIRVAVLNVQGGARREAIALLEAAREVHDFNVEVHLVENGEQLESVKAHALLFPGGWHKNQFEAQEELGINKVIVELIRRKVHILALCAGCIQTRSAHNELDGVQSEGCATGTTFGVGKYQIVNNVLSGPSDVLMAFHNNEDPDASTARVLEDIPFSNGPYIVGADMDQLEVIARLSTTSRAKEIDDDDGNIVGVQVSNQATGVPVQMAAAFHDPAIFQLWLHEIGVFKTKIRHRGELEQQRAGYRASELRLTGLTEEEKKTD